MAACALALAACSSSAAKQPQAQVPSLPAVVATSGSASANAGAGPNAGASAGTTSTATAARPRITLDMTNTQINALYNQYSQCMATNGYSKEKNVQDQAARTKAENACVSEDPLPPWQLDASNPKAGAFVHAVVQCLRDKGVQYVSENNSPQNGQVGFSFGGPDNDSQSITLGMQDTPECEKQVAAQGLGS
ncbi:hypothetical protein [Catenulispora sp. EB89]|uniref:hypothetical protein n=1 Tax=Catenulispora sp. EB89 TaxID=3156257 RepID=UPI003518D805